MATNLLSPRSIVSAYTAFATSMMVVKTALREIQHLTNQVIPLNLQEKLISRFKNLFHSCVLEDEHLTLNIADRADMLNKNQIYDTAQTYLSTKINNSDNKRLDLHKDSRDKSVTVTLDNGEEMYDDFEGIKLKWVMLRVVVDNKNGSQSDLPYGYGPSKERRSMELTFPKQHKETVLERYIPYILDIGAKIQAEKRVTKLYKLDFGKSTGINLQHPSTFDTLAMEPKVKADLIEDLDRFVRRRDYYRRVGKVWKRGYLLYGPPGTGKSSLIAAMANYLNFHIYDMDLSRMRGADFRQMLVTTENRSIIVIEDIDCSSRKELPNREKKFFDDFGFDETGEEGFHIGGSKLQDQNQDLPLAGLLNFIDGLWSCCGDERIIIFTTNYKERIDPALLRPGRMDMHIHLSYLTFGGFQTLAYNYLNTSSHPLFAQIEDLLKEVQITPATVAEELMKSDDVDQVLEGFVQVLLKMKEDGDVQLEQKQKTKKQQMKHEEPSM